MATEWNFQNYTTFKIYRLISQTNLQQDKKNNLNTNRLLISDDVRKEMYFHDYKSFLRCCNDLAAGLLTGLAMDFDHSQTDQILGSAHVRRAEEVDGRGIVKGVDRGHGFLGPFLSIAGAQK